MYLITGLGNPGEKYRSTRHNVGFMLVDRIAQEWGVQFDRLEAQSLVGEVQKAGERVVLAKPQTFMNLSGRAVRGLVQKYSLDPSRLLVVYDDIALPLGRIRIRASGSAGGQKGIQSVLEALGTEEVPRLRIGISGNPSLSDFSDYVLSEFRRGELQILEEVLELSVTAVDSIITDGLERAMAVFNPQVRPEKDET